MEETMKNDTQKNILFLAITGVVLILVNVAVFMGARNGQITPVDNLVLWGAFALLSVCSLLWTVSVLGLQPMVVAAAYVIGGLLAFRGVRLMPGMHVAEITSAGAAYGAFGAVVVGHATTKVRLAYFNKRQVPFVFAIIALLLMNGFLNSRVSTAGWNVIASALVLPFMLAGVIVGLAWMILMRVRAGRASVKKETQVAEAAEPIMAVAAQDEGAPQLRFSVPANADVVESMEVTELPSDPEPMEMKDSPLPMVEADLLEDESYSDQFFPLEIDKEGIAILLDEDDPELMNVAAMVAESAPEPTVEVDRVSEPEQPPLEEAPPHREEGMGLFSEETPVLKPEPVEESRAQVPQKEKLDSNDWLSSHLDLLDKLEK